MSITCKMSLFIYKTGEIKDKTVFTSFYFSDMHLHAYSKASYQTHTNTLCHLHELQIISGTSVQIRTEKLICPGWESEKQNRWEGRTKSKLLAHWCDCSAAAVVRRNRTGRIFSKQTCVKIPFKMLCFVFKIYLVGGAPEPGSAASLAADRLPSSTDRCRVKKLWNQSVGGKKNRIWLQVCPAAPIGNANGNHRGGKKKIERYLSRSL